MKKEKAIQVLLVENDTETASLIKRHLEKKHPAKVEVAGDCASARQKLNQGAFEMIILDYKLPDGDGLQLLEEVTALDSQPPVIMVTGPGDESVADSALKAGLSGYVVKGSKLKTLLSEAVEVAVDKISLKRTVDAVRENEEFYRTLFEESSDALFIETINGTIEEVNQAACEMLGYTAEELKGKLAIELIPPDRRKEFESAVSSLLKGESIKFVNIHKEGHAIPVEVVAKEVATRRGPRYVVGARDISEHKRTEEALRNIISETNERREEITALLESTRSVLEHRDFKSAAWEIFNSCKRLVGATAGYVSVLTHEKENREIMILNSSAAHFAAEAGTTVPITGIAAEVYRSGRPKYDNDFTPAEGQVPLDNVLIAPLIIQGKTEGLICLANKPGRFSTQDTMMASAFGEIAALSLRQSRTLEMLENSEARFRSVAETASDAIISGDSRGIIIQWNQAAKQMFGYSASEMVGEPLTSIMPERFRETNIETLRQIRKKGALDSPRKTYDQAGLKKDGSEFPLEATLSIWEVRGELYFTVIIRDITERRQAENALRESEEGYRRVVESAPEAIYTISSDRTLVSLNPAFEKLTGWPVDEWVGRPFAELIHPDDLQKAIETFEIASGGETLRPYELRIRKKSGDYLVGEFTSMPWVVSGKVVGEFGIARDITDRKKTEERLRESEELYRGLLQASPEAVTATDLEGKVTYASRRTAEMHGFESSDQIIGMSAFEMIAPEDRDRAFRNLQRTLEEGLVQDLEYKLVRKDGTSFAGELSATVLRDSNGNPKNFIATTRDITERKRAEEKLRALNVELEGYAHAVSHDLRGPLSAIVAASKTLKGLLGKPFSEDVKSAIDGLAGIISNSVEKSNKLIEDLLVLAESEQELPQASQVKVTEIVESILGEREAEISRKSIKVNVDDDLGSVFANRTHIYQLFSNLLENAIKHNNSKRPSVTVKFLGDDPDGGYRYLVKDNGSGIPPQDLERIFLPFYSGKGGGTGTGLATVSRIVSLHRGSIKAYNDKGANIEFVINDLQKN